MSNDFKTAIMKQTLFSSMLTRVVLILIFLSLQNFAFAKGDFPDDPSSTVGKIKKPGTRVLTSESFFNYNSEIKDIVVRGVVRDQDGNSLAGATITEKGTTNSVIAGARGDFSITVKEGATLTVSYVGYELQEMAVTAAKDMEIITLMTPGQKAIQKSLLPHWASGKKKPKYHMQHRK